MPELLTRKIVLISDYVDPNKYSPQELAHERSFIATAKNELNAYGMQVVYLEVTSLADLQTALNHLDKTKVVIFNWCEFLNEQEGTAHIVTKYLTESGFTFTGASTECLVLTASKAQTKRVLGRHAIPTPAYSVIKRGKPTSAHPNYPLMLKLEDRHSSAGITADNVVYTPDQVTKVAHRLYTAYGADVLAEEFIAGQEYTCTVWGNGAAAACVYISQEKYKDPGTLNINTEAGKFVAGSPDDLNLVSTELRVESIKRKLCDTVLKTYTALKFTDYGRFELREKNGIYYVIDCNPNPWLGLDAVLFKGTKKLGYNYGETLLQICEFAVQRNIR
jgi:D-alanine-D-alanine ligase